LELRECGERIMRRTPQALLDTWHLKLCVDRTTVVLSIILQLASSLTNVCLVGDRILENREKKSVTIFFQSKYKLSELKFRWDGQLKQQIS